MKFAIVATLLACVVVSAVAQDFPNDIGLCGEGSCKVTPVIKNADGVATGVGPVEATLPLGEPGSYPTIIALCGRGTCVTVPVEVVGMTPEEVMSADGLTPQGDWPDSIGLCGRGTCRVTPVIKDASGVATGVGPVATTGGAGNYPTNVGVCGRGVCVALPVVTTGRKLK